MQDSLIILLGMPRSGTTWLGKLFDSHPDTYYLHEPDSYRPFSGIPLLVNPEERAGRRQELKDFVGTLLGSHSTKVCGSLPVFRKRYLSSFHYTWRRSAVLAAKFGAKIFGEFPVLDGIRTCPDKPMTLVWKSIESVGRAGFLASALPDARLIFEIRHPCGYIASIKRGERQGRFSAEDSISNDFGLMQLLLDTQTAHKRQLSMEDLKSSHPIERLAWQWLLFNEKALEELEMLKNAMIVRYEDLCVQPVGVTRRLFEFAGLPWDRQTEDFLQNSTSDEKKDYYSVFKNPERAANKWKEELASGEIEMVRNIVASSRAGALYFDGSA